MIPNPFKRGVKVPDSVVRAAGLRPGERVLAGTQADGDAWLLGTHEALHVVRGSGEDLRIPWERVERADWDRDEERLVVSEVGEFGRVRPQHSFAVEEPGLLLELVRERVTASVVLQRRVAVRGKRGLTVIGRRPPGGDGEVAWAYEFDPGVDPEDPAVMAAAEAALRTAQGDLGL
ncbi:MAG TPA: hypothetical protein VFR87_10805 [Nocardioidaceae bacterium]|nr:hypothetical protein [Nocardioidaceae bacterium]